MPTEEQLQYEIALARIDLEANLIDLQNAIRDKVDVKRIARDALAGIQQRAHEIYEVRQLQARLFAQRVIAYVRARPIQTAAIAAGVIGLITGGIVWQRHRHLS
jgi:ElaB/YqjD/DUF883 family membrane-anchored ribosome-binding protein